MRTQFVPFFAKAFLACALLLPVLSSPAQAGPTLAATGSGVFCIDGVGTGTGYTWAVVDTATNTSLEAGALVTGNGDSAATMVAALVAAINGGAGSPTDADAAAGGAGCTGSEVAFTVTWTGPFDLQIDGTAVIAGIDTTFNPIIKRFPPAGDADGDGFVNAFDNCSAVSNPTQTDANMDGCGDLCSPSPVPVGHPFSMSCDGDGDGIVGGGDFIILAVEFGNTAPPQTMDCNGNGIVGGDDFIILAVEFGRRWGTSGIQHPSLVSGACNNL